MKLCKNNLCSKLEIIIAFRTQLFSCRRRRPRPRPRPRPPLPAYRCCCAR